MKIVEFSLSILMGWGMVNFQVLKAETKGIIPSNLLASCVPTPLEKPSPSPKPSPKTSPKPSPKPSSSPSVKT